jgi:putative FmdB family regulatory protein
MPTYEYVCEACGNAWEAVQRISEDPLKDCPKCNAPKAKRQISGGTNFILKGGGWYSDLYASSGKPKSETKATTPATETKTEAPKADAPAAPAPSAPPKASS